MTKFKPRWNPARALLPLLIALPGAAHAADTWTPAGKWNLDFGDAGCRIGRVFSSGAREASFGFTSAPTRPEFSLLLTIPDTMFTSRAKVITVSAPGITPVEVRSFGVTPLKSGVKLITIQLDRANFAPFLSAREVSIEGAGSAVTIQTGGSAGIATAMTKCEEDLIREWKIEPAEIDRIATPSKPINPAGWITFADYPPAALRDGLEGTATALMRADVTGKVQECRVVASSGTRVLDETTCKLFLMRARYSPALDKDGRPVPSWMMLAFRWVARPSY
jgi:TonB family protein